MPEPQTKAGRALFTDVEPMDMWESDGVTPGDIAAIEQEAAAAERARLISPFATAGEYEAWFRDSEARAASAVAAERTRLTEMVEGLDSDWCDTHETATVHRYEVLDILQGEP